jgi:hypothetical protein
VTLAGQDLRDVVHDLVAGVVPLDEHEVRDKASTLRWVRSGAPLFRVARPATPDKHLCVYFALFEEARRTVLLADHVKAACGSSPVQRPRISRRRDYFSLRRTILGDGYGLGGPTVPASRGKIAKSNQGSLDYNIVTSR